MSTHNPATPLPWAVETDILFGAKVIGPEIQNARTILSQGDDSHYIAHCANAYPTLVETAREELTTLEAVNIPGRDDGAYARKVRIIKLRALLRELGEIE